MKSVLFGIAAAACLMAFLGVVIGVIHLAERLFGQWSPLVVLFVFIVVIVSAAHSAMDKD